VYASWPALPSAHATLAPGCLARACPVRTFTGWTTPALAGAFRVSSKAQDYAAQVEALKAADCERIYSEKASGKSRDGRPEFNKLMNALLPGDRVVVVKLDRPARSSRGLHNIIHDLEGLSVGFQSLGESWCDTTTDVGKLMLTIMGGIAEFERSLIRKHGERPEGSIFSTTRCSRDAVDSDMDQPVLMARRQQ